jgi:hypothetical protein
LTTLKVEEDPMLYINAEVDEHGNIRYPPAIIEAELFEKSRLRITAPAEMASRWPTMSQDYWTPIDADGPRMLTEEQWWELCRPGQPFPG